MNRVLVLLVAAVAINYVDRGALSVSAPSLTRELSLSPTEMGWLFSAFFWSYASFQIAAGWLVDRYAVKWIYAAGFLVWSIATGAVGLAGSFTSLVAARFLLGIGESVAYPATSRVIVENFPETRRGLANALVDAGSKLGPAVSTLAGGLLVERYGWRAMFYGLGFGSLLWLLPWLLWMPATHGAAQAAGAQTRGPGLLDILRRRAAQGTCLGMFALGYVWYFLLSWLPSYLVKERGFSLARMAVLGSIPFWAMAVSAVCNGALSDRLIARGASPTLVRRAFAVSGLLLCGAAMAPAALVRDAGQSVALLTAACVALGLFTSNCWAITQTLAGPLAAGKWTGIQNAIGNLGGVVSPVLTGWIVEQTGSFALAFAAAAAVLVAGAAAYLIMVTPIATQDWSRHDAE